MGIEEDFFWLSCKSMWNKRGEGELFMLLLMSMLLGVPGSAMVNFGVCVPKVLGIPMVVGVLRTAAMSARLWS